MSRAEILKRRADEAAQVRHYETDPDVVAYRLERRAILGTGLIWAGIVLGLAFTVPNVQRFVAGDAEPWSIVWTTAWLLDVMVSLPLIGVLVLEQAVTRHEVQLGAWARVLKWGSLSATYAMNTWESWASLDAAGILVHSVPPLVVFVCAEVLPTGRERITEAVRNAVAVLPRPDQPAVATTVEEVRDEPVRELPSSPPMVEQDPLLGYAARIADEYRQNYGQPIPVPVLCKRLGVAEPVAARLHAQLV